MADIASAVGNRHFAALAMSHASSRRGPRILARSPQSDSLEKHYDRVIHQSHKSGNGFVSLLGAALRDLLPITASPDPDMGPAIVRIVDRICKLSYKDWFDADAKTKPVIAERVTAMTADAPYLQIGNAQLAHEIVDMVTTLRTSFHEAGSSGYTNAQNWGTGILTNYARTRL
jgi:hypothetical protein